MIWIQNLCISIWISPPTAYICCLPVLDSFLDKRRQLWRFSGSREADSCPRTWYARIKFCKPPGPMNSMNSNDSESLWPLNALAWNWLQASWTWYEVRMIRCCWKGLLLQTSGFWSSQGCENMGKRYLPTEAHKLYECSSCSLYKAIRT
jgi:hypothetical protein